MPKCGMILFNGSCDNCIYGNGKPVTCKECEGILRGGFCFPCNFKAENSFICDQNAYSFNDNSNNSNYLPQPQYENHLCNLCGNNSHDGYDCQQQFPSNQEKEETPQESDIRQLIREECCIEVSEEQKQSMEDMMLELVKICRQKEILCMHDNVKDLIESALNSKFLSINSNSQRLDKKEQEVENVVEQPFERGTLTKESKHSLSMGCEHLSITPETESDEVTESCAKNLLPIPSECEVTSEDESKCDMPAKDDCSPAFTTFSNPLFNNNDDLDSSYNESLPEKDVLADEFKVYSNPLSDEDEINSDNRIEMLFTINLRPYPTVNANTNDKSLPSLPIPVQDNDSQREEIDIITSTNDVLPPGVENDDSNGEVDSIDDLRIDNSILNSEHEYSESEESDFDNSSVPRPPPKPPDAEFAFEPDAGKEIPVVINEKDEDLSLIN
uniref:Pre-mRNA splicing Prp18-interacting factor n=1 Tax=Tanacetum cinerariifolium TaxID=118510 RepID=A0A6L2P950_TANCI|nr:hypothetical protein [Tanacetum cinerariifolium]